MSVPSEFLSPTTLIAASVAFTGRSNQYSGDLLAWIDFVFDRERSKGGVIVAGRVARERCRWSARTSMGRVDQKATAAGIPLPQAALRTIPRTAKRDAHPKSGPAPYRARYCLVSGTVRSTMVSGTRVPGPLATPCPSGRGS